MAVFFSNICGFKQLTPFSNWELSNCAQVAEFVKTFLAPELASAYANDEPKEGPITDKRLMKVTEAVFQRMDSRIATELAGGNWDWEHENMLRWQKARNLRFQISWLQDWI